MTEEEQLLTAVLGCRRIDLYLDRPPLKGGQLRRLREMRRRRRGGEPLQYIIGSADFMGLDLKVDPRVFIPRPETEGLVEEVAARVRRQWGGRPVRILDLGTGSGNIAVALAVFLPEAVVTAVERSAEALEVARTNAARHGVADRIRWVHRDMEAFLREGRRPACVHDVLVSNPPYVPTGECAFLPVDVRQEPVTALDGGVDGLRFYRAIFAGARCVLNATALIALEIGEGQAEAVRSLAEAAGITEGGILPDAAGRPRIAVFALHRAAGPWGI